MNHFQVGDRSQASRAPVHDVLTAINKSLFPKTHENLAHGTVEVFVHGEVLARPVNRIAEPLHLLENIAAVEATPLPHAFDELLTSKVGAFCPFACELSLNQHLRRNAGVVCTGNPERDFTTHSPPTHKNVRLGVLEHVPHVQIAGHVWRRQQNRERRWCVLGRSLNVKKPLVHPVLGPARLDGAWVIGFWKLVGHDGST